VQSRIQEYPDFTTKTEDETIALVEAIKIIIHDEVRPKYPLRINVQVICKANVR